MADGFRLEDDSGVIVLEDGTSILLKEIQSSLLLYTNHIAPIFYYVLARRAGR